MTEKQPDIHNRYRSDDLTFDWVTTNGNVEQANQIKQELRKVFDPEIHINVHDLGLIYKMDVDNDNNVDIIWELEGVAQVGLTQTDANGCVTTEFIELIPPFVLFPIVLRGPETKEIQDLLQTQPIGNIYIQLYMGGICIF